MVRPSAGAKHREVVAVKAGEGVVGAAGAASMAKAGLKGIMEMEATVVAQVIIMEAGRRPRTLRVVVAVVVEARGGVERMLTRKWPL